MIVVNLFGAPGAGKSTLAAYIFSQLKFEGQNIELVTEFAKDVTWEENQMALSDQAQVFGCQNYRLTRLKGKVDLVITDSPILLSILYNHNQILGPSFNVVVCNMFDSYDNINYLVKRTKPYNPIGRNQTEEESDELYGKLKGFLDEYSIEYKDIEGNKQYADEIVAMLKERLEEIKLMNTKAKEEEPDEQI